MSMNRVCLMGRIGRDLELKKTNSGVSVVSFPLAVDRNGKEGGTDWIDIVAWRGTAEVLCNYADKGRMIGVEGRLQMRDWTDKNGNKRRSYEVQADNVYSQTTGVRRITTPPHRNTTPQRAPQAALQRSARMTASCRFKAVTAWRRAKNMSSSG